MKTFNRVFIILFFMILGLPLVFFERDAEAVSALDNRALAQAPEARPGSADFSEELENYLADRCGFRETFISAYSNMEALAFHELGHPLYEYGKDNEAFVVRISGYGDECSDYLAAFENMVIEMNRYLRERGVVFVFALDPSKSSVYEDCLPAGLSYRKKWREDMLARLRDAGVCCVDNTVTLEELRKNGIRPYNRLYDVGHWNDNGAFYGVNAIVQAFRDQGIMADLLSEDDFEMSVKTEEFLPTSDIRINEDVPLYKPILTSERVHPELYGILRMAVAWREFDYKLRKDAREGDIKLLSFQGSYLNVPGRPFMERAFPEYISVHCYQNVMDMDYYLEIFQPDAVLFEMADFTFEEIYFWRDKIENMSLAPLYRDLDAYEERDGGRIELTIEAGEVFWECLLRELPEGISYAYISFDGKEESFTDMHKEPYGFSYTRLAEEAPVQEGARLVLVNETEQIKLAYDCIFVYD